ncbi:MAG: hypothetical protein F2754_00805 [Actinobacteria bacterium]|uniref:Unannotated protein n=1 Tax=freshwater metagenome TaxID=449393 RepID=A0A6J6YXZ8_9ZZZZ|nr:hypothetical protein [Actinomycetota bacterium]
MTLADGPVILVLLDDDGTRRLHLVLAEGWQVHDAPGTLAVLRPAVDHGWFRTNVVISREGVPADLDLATVMAAGERHVAATYDAVEVRSERVAHCGDAAAVVRLRAFDVRNEGVRLSQLHALLDADLEHPHSSARVIYQIVASCLAEDTARFQHAFTTMIGSCRVHLSPTRERPEEIE